MKTSLEWRNLCGLWRALSYHAVLTAQRRGMIPVVCTVLLPSMWDALEKAEEDAESVRGAKKHKTVVAGDRDMSHNLNKTLVESESTRIPKLSAATRLQWHAKLVEALQDNDMPVYVAWIDWRCHC